MSADLRITQAQAITAAAALRDVAQFAADEAAAIEAMLYQGDYATPQARDSLAEKRNELLQQSIDLFVVVAILERAANGGPGFAVRVALTDAASV